MEEQPLGKQLEYSESAISATVTRLQKHVNNKDFYTRPTYAIVEGGHITHDLKCSNQRRSWYRNTMFDGAILDGVGFADSVFYLTDFTNTSMANTNFKSCVFQNCTLQTGKPVVYAGFGNSVFRSCIMQDTTYKYAGFAECVFDNTYITNCKFYNTTFEGAVFKDSLFSNIEFHDLNLEFVEFRDVRFESVTLPFNTIPFIFNGIRYLMNTRDNVYIKSTHNSNGYISVQEYMDIVPDLLIYFEANENYFPLSNILIAKGEYSYAMECIMKGITGAIQIGSFRMLRFFCRLLQITDHYTFQQKHHVYQRICEQINQHIMVTNLAPNYQFNISDIKRILFESNDCIGLSYRIQTNISDNDYESVQLFYSLVHHIIQSAGFSSGYSIQYSYNSNAEIFLQFVQLDPAILVALIAAFSSMFSLGVNTYISAKQYRANMKELQLKIEDSHAKRLPNEQFLEKHKREMQLLELESQRKQMEIQQLQRNNEKIKIENDTLFLALLSQIEQQYPSIEQFGDRLKEKGIRINGYSHNVNNLDHSLLSDTLLEIVYAPSVSERQ